MEQHDKAAAELGNVKGDEKDPAFKAIRLMYVRELRLSKTPDNVKKAREVLTDIVGTAAKPGWGARDLTARIENGLLMHEEGRWNEAFTGWVALVKALAPQVAKGGPVRERYFEIYYYMIFSSVKMGQASSAADARGKAMENAAHQILTLESSWPDLGGEASAARFNELLASEAELKAKYDELKSKKK
jgi:hypothetical protein